MAKIEIDITVTYPDGSSGHGSYEKIGAHTGVVKAALDEFIDAEIAASRTDPDVLIIRSKTVRG
ncbi:MAG: hypothetical protein ABSG95_09400 [Solirubrobacteraceae bacterium]|jgi:hypothetical protein